MKHVKKTQIRERSLVTLVDASDAGTYAFKDDLPLIYLGEIANMQSHGIFAGTKTGKVYSGYHVGSFRELREDEI